MLCLAPKKRDVIVLSLPVCHLNLKPRVLNTSLREFSLHDNDDTNLWSVHWKLRLWSGRYGRGGTSHCDYVHRNFPTHANPCTWHSSNRKQSKSSTSTELSFRHWCSRWFSPICNSLRKWHSPTEWLIPQSSRSSFLYYSFHCFCWMITLSWKAEGW